MSGPIRTLAGDFPATTPDNWRELAMRAIKGRDFDQTLVRTTQGGIPRGPIAFDSDLERPAGILPESRDSHLPWSISQTYVASNPSKANAAILADLTGGVSAIELTLDKTGQRGISVTGLDELSRAIEGVDPSLAPVHLSPGSVPEHAQWLAKILASRVSDCLSLQAGFGLRPDDSNAYAFAQETQESLPQSLAIQIDGRAVHDAGGHEIQELAFAALGLNQAMRGLLSHGIEPDQAAKRIGLTLAVDADIHLSISKLRAARRIWTSIMEGFDVSKPNRRGHIKALTSFRMMAARDPWTNLIRLSSAGFAGAVGGADTLTIRCLTDAIGRPTAFGHRLSRNLQILLQEESHLGRVADPAGGAFLHEQLTEKLAQTAWSAFQQLEREGGYEAAVSGEGFTGELAKAKTKLIDAYAAREDILVGVNQHVPDEVRPIAASDSNWKANLPTAPFEPMRIAASFEAANTAEGGSQ